MTWLLGHELQGVTTGGEAKQEAKAQNLKKNKTKKPLRKKDIKIN